MLTRLSHSDPTIVATQEFTPFFYWSWIRSQKKILSSGGARGVDRGARPPLFLDEKNFFCDRGPPLICGVWMIAPPPPPIIGRSGSATAEGKASTNWHAQTHDSCAFLIWYILHECARYVRCGITKGFATFFFFSFSAKANRVWAAKVTNPRK